MLLLATVEHRKFASHQHKVLVR